MAEAATHHNNEIVSSEDELLILVDEADREIGSLSKGACHDGEGVLHRAFSVFVFNAAGELLLQRRSDEKRLWPHYWSNSCCSHPRHGESMELATGRRLSEELGIESRIHHLFTFQYQAAYKDLGSENEVCWVYVGLCDDQPQPNPNEISAIRWISPSDLDREFEKQPDHFTPWFAMEWPRVRNVYRETLGLQKVG